MSKTFFTMWRLVFGSKGKYNRRRRRSKRMRRKHSQGKKKGETLNTEQEPQLKSGKPGIRSEYYWVPGLLYTHCPRLKES